MKLNRKKLRAGVTFELEVEFDDTPIHGSFASGDDAADLEHENELIERVNSGDVWAWAVVTVTARFGEFTGRDVLGGCSYRDQADFEADGYFADMQAEALADLERNILTAIGNLEGVVTL